MEKSEFVPLPKARAARAKTCHVKPRQKVAGPKVGRALKQADVVKMIDHIRKELESRYGSADEATAAFSETTQPGSEAGRKKELDPELGKLLLIKKLLEASLPAAAENHENPTARPEPNGAKKILVVDDDSTTVKIITHFLEKENYRVSTSFSGIEGLEKAFQEPPDLILLDIMMPDLNGFQWLSIYRKDKETARTPVVILSSLSEEADVLKGLEIGAVDYITKPFSPQVLMAKIKKNLNLGP